MIDDPEHREIVAAILAAGIMSASPKAYSTTRAVSEFRAVLDALAAPEPSPPVLEPRSGPPTARASIEWVHPE